MRLIWAPVLVALVGCARIQTPAARAVVAKSHRPRYNIDQKFLRVGNALYRYFVFTPESCRNHLCPVVIALHGRGGHAQQALESVQDVAFEHGFIVIAPQSQGDRWRDMDQDPLQQRELSFFGKILDSVPSLGGDPKRVYVTGFSNGGGMTFFLGAYYSKRIAAIAGGGASIGALDERLVYHTLPNPKRPIPVLIFHGMRDPISGYGMETFAVPIPDAARWWARKDRLPLRPIHSELARGKVRVDRYGHGHGPEVVLMSFRDMGHAWPSSQDSATGLHFNEMWWTFLSRYSLG